MSAYYQDDRVTIYHGDCREVVTPAYLHGAAYVVATDPPYPNNAGHFDDAVDAARELLPNVDCPAIVFWSELERPPVPATSRRCACLAPGQRELMGHASIRTTVDQYGSLAMDDVAEQLAGFKLEDL